MSLILALQHRLLAPLFAALAVLALAFNVLVPPGTMAVAGAAGARIVLCTGNGPVNAVLAADGTLHKQPESDQRPHAPVCSFAGHMAPLLPLLAYPAFLLRVAFAPAPLALRPAGIAPGRGMVAPPPPSQAPPLSHR